MLSLWYRTVYFVWIYKAVCAILQPDDQERQGSDNQQEDLVLLSDPSGQGTEDPKDLEKF